MTAPDTTLEDAYWECLDEEMNKELECPGCGLKNRFGDMIDRSRFKIVKKGGIRCRKVNLRLECPHCAFLYESDPGFLPLARPGHLESPIETWRRHRGLPPLTSHRNDAPAPRRPQT